MACSRGNARHETRGRSRLPALFGCAEDRRPSDLLYSGVMSFRGPRRVALVSVHTSPLAQPGTGDAGGMNVYVWQTAQRLARPRDAPAPGERRVAATPETVKKLVAAGARVVVERGAGAAAGFIDQAYADAGAAVDDGEGVGASSCPHAPRARAGMAANARRALRGFMRRLLSGSRGAAAGRC